MKRAILVNGVPASGKSTVARALSDRHGWPLFAVDTIKEPFFTELGIGDRAYNRKLGRAAYAAIFDTIAAFPDPHTVIIEAWFGFQPAELLRDHLARAELSATVEIWCQADPETIGQRYAARVPQRPAGHPGLDYVPELVALAGLAQPIDVGPTLRLATDRPADPGLVDAFLKESGFLA